jgi:glutamyl-tRNA synthetase
MSQDQSAQPTVVTRFAPSPTGFLHIGGARTALFNWLYARHCGGRYVLRIEDTDRARSTDEAIAAILDGLAWLGLESDAEPVFQFARADRHREVVETLLGNGHAYKCYCTPEDLAEMRAKAEAEGRSPVYDGRWRDRDPAEAPAGVSPAIRLKTRREGETVVDDQVQGRVVFDNANLDDLIILRSDGTPTYNLAVVVDDHDMAITHVVRGVDHLTNAARQTQIYNAMQWDVPVFAHVPLIHGPDGAKLSKRHGALGVEAYRAMGYLPAALRNYLVRLGWSHGDDEMFTTAEMIAWFDFDGLGKSPARFDFAKLADFNAHYIRATSDDELIGHLKRLLEDLPEGPQIARDFERIGWAKLKSALPSLKERAKTLNDLIDGANFLIAERPLVLDEKAIKLLDGAAQDALGALAPRLAQVANWSLPNIEQVIRDFAKERDLKLGKLLPPVRAALTGRTASPSIFEVMALIGQPETLARIKDHCTD